MNIRVCPQCGSSKVCHTDTVIAGSDTNNATCTSCGWQGQVRDLMRAIVPSKNLGVDPNLALATEVAKTYMALLAKHVAQPIGLAMVQSGVVGAKDKDTLGRLIRAACLGAHRATLDEIESMQKELQDEQRN